MNEQTNSLKKFFDDLQSRIANLKSVKNLKEFKHDSVLIKKWSPTYLLPEFEIILDYSLAFTIKVYKCGCYWKIMKHKNLTKGPYKRSLYQTY